MTTASWSTVLDQSTDAGFRTWGSELSGKFAAVGMVQTADTGQINWTTVTRAAVINTSAGYEIWRLSGSALFFKIEYGTGSPQPNAPAQWLTVGTGSNGTGTLTGQLSTRTQMGAGNAPASLVTNYQSYLCATASFFGLSWKIGSSTAATPRCFMGAAQTVDNTGSPTTVGYETIGNIPSSSFVSQCVATTAGVTGTQISGATGGSPFFIPNNAANPPANSLDGSGNNQAFLWWYSILGTTPMQPLIHFASALLTDFTLGTTASMTLVGSTPHTYISAGAGTVADGFGKVSAPNLTVCMLFE